MGDRLPVRWEKTAILVMNEVRVSHPYLPDNVLGGPPAANERVRKVVRSCSMPQGYIHWSTLREMVIQLLN